MNDLYERRQKSADALRAAERKRVEAERDFYLATAAERQAWLEDYDASAELERSAREEQEALNAKIAGMSEEQRKEFFESGEAEIGGQMIGGLGRRLPPRRLI